MDITQAQGLVEPALVIEDGCLMSSPLRRQAGRRRNRRRKTLSPSKVTTFLSDVRMTDDPMSFPDPPSEGESWPCAQRGCNGPEEEGPMELPTQINANVVGQGALECETAGQVSVDQGSITRSRVRFREKDVFAPVVNRQSSGVIDVGDGKTSIRIAKDKPVRSMLMETENCPPVPKAESSTRRRSRPGAVFDEDNTARQIESGDPRTQREDRETKDKVRASRRSRRRSLVMPSENKDLDLGIDGGVHLENEKQQKNPHPTGEASCSRSIDHSWGIDKPRKDLAKLIRGYCREPKDSQRARRIAARIFGLTGYPLLPDAARDAQILCSAAGGDQVWGLDDEEPNLTGCPPSARTRAEMKKLIVRIKPVLLEMEKETSREKRETEEATGIVGCKSSQEGFCYKDAKTGEPVSHEVYKARYMAHIETLRLARRAEFAKLHVVAEVSATGGIGDSVMGTQKEIDPKLTSALDGHGTTDDSKSGGLGVEENQDHMLNAVPVQACPVAVMLEAEAPLGAEYTERSEQADTEPGRARRSVTKVAEGGVQAGGCGSAHASILLTGSGREVSDPVSLIVDPVRSSPQCCDLKSPVSSKADKETPMAVLETITPYRVEEGLVQVSLPRHLAAEPDERVDQHIPFPPIAAKMSPPLLMVDHLGAGVEEDQATQKNCTSVTDEGNMNLGHTGLVDSEEITTDPQPPKSCNVDVEEVAPLESSACTTNISIELAKATEGPVSPRTWTKISEEIPLGGETLLAGEDLEATLDEMQKHAESILWDKWEAALEAYNDELARINTCRQVCVRLMPAVPPGVHDSVSPVEVVRECVVEVPPDSIPSSDWNPSLGAGESELAPLSPIPYGDLRL
ncbi:unnamed protein product, partial [Choristocarpus tenellus]